MKILVVCQHYYPEPFRITDICENLVKQGHKVTVLTGLPNYPEGKVLESYRKKKNRKEVINGVNIIRSYEIGRGKSKIMLILNYLSSTLTSSWNAYFLKENFDVVFSYQLSPIFMVLPAIIYKKRNNTKLLLYCLDLWPDSLAAGGIKSSSILYKIIHQISRRIYMAADTIFVSSKMFIEYFKEKLKIYDINLKYLPQYAEDQFQEMTDQTFIKNDKDTLDLIFAGNIGNMQSVKTIIYAANELKSYPHIKFHIVGEGSDLSNCKLLSEKLNLQNVFYHGRKPISDMPYYYQLADAFLITMKDNKEVSKTLPGKVQSYLASGKPIIGSINGETYNLINDAGVGFCCNAEDYRTFSKLILKFADLHNEDKINMGKKAYNYYMANFTKDLFFSKLVNELRNLEERNV